MLSLLTISPKMARAVRVLLAIFSPGTSWRVSTEHAMRGDGRSWHLAARHAGHRRLVDAPHARALRASERRGDVARRARPDGVHRDRQKKRAQRRKPIRAL